MTTFSFIHASDLHLDTPFRGVSDQPPAVTELLRTATLDAFESLVRLCIEKDAAFLLVAGDIFDGSDRNLRAQLRFRDGVARLAERGIQTFVSLGDHDAAETWAATLEWPKGVHVFSAERAESVTAMRNGAPLAQVAGLSHAKPGEERNLARELKPERTELFQIALLHANCGVAGHSPVAPCAPGDLAGAGFNYWALGHVHDRQILADAPAVAYPGNPQGRCFHETGPRGCLLVQVDGQRRTEITFQPLDAVRWLEDELNIQGVGSVETLARLIGQKMESLRAAGGGRPVIARLTLEGRGPLYYDLNREAITADLLERTRKAGMAADPLVWVQALDNRTRPELDLDRRARSQDLVGQMLTVSRELGAGAIEETLAPVLSALYEDGQARRALEPLTAEALKAILADAELLCLDQLEKDE